MQLKLFIPKTVIIRWLTALVQPLRREKEYVMSEQVKALLESFDLAHIGPLKPLIPRLEDLAPDGAFPLCDGCPTFVRPGDNFYEDTFGW
jgi:hypothetical protein